MTNQLAWAGLLGMCLLGVAAASAAEPVVPDSVIWESGIEYAAPDQMPLHLNLARPKAGEGPFPAVLCIHGGGFRAGKRES